MPTPFPHTLVQAITSWSNYHGTISGLTIPTACIPGAPPGPADAASRMRRHGEALDAIVRHCFERSAKVRTAGATWSLSNVILPGEVLIDPGHMNNILKIGPSWMTAAHAAATGAHRGVPVLAEGGTHVSALNRRLAALGLALRTSGAGDGHRIAGCIATGTHGAAIGVGAVHDTVQAIHLLVAPGRALLLQPSTAFFKPDLADWLTQTTGIPTRDTPDDELLHAAQVSLGSLGVVMSVVLDTVSLYGLRRRVLARPAGDADVLRTLADLEVRRLFPDETEVPHHFQAIFNPYPSTHQPGAFVNAMWRVATPPPPRPAGAPDVDGASDLLGLVASLVNGLNGPLTKALVGHLIGNRLVERYRPGDRLPARPGEIFGATQNPPGVGTSIELAVDQVDLPTALPVVLDAIQHAASDGHLLLGAVGVRLVAGTRAPFGMNIHRMTAFIEVPSLRNGDAARVHQRIWSALDAAGVRYACHWGQMHNLTLARVRAYYGARLDHWRAARQQLLDATGREVFASQLVTDLGI